jgi:hypothetical protein
MTSDFAFSLGFLVLIFLVLIFNAGDGVDELRKIHALSSGGLPFSSSSLEK